MGSFLHRECPTISFLLLLTCDSMYRYLGSMIYNSKELLLVCNIARKNKEQEEQEKVDRAKKKETALFKRVEEARGISRLPQERSSPL